MELIRGIRESPRRRPRRLLLRLRVRTDIPKWVDKAGHRLVGVDARDGYDEIVVEKTH